MICAWEELLSILPLWMRREVDSLGKQDARELRLRMDGPPRLFLQDGSHALSGTVTQEDLNFIINTASRYSPWAAATIARGYITAQGGHRIGICGDGVVKNGELTGMRNLSSLCIRIARDFPGLAEPLKGITGSILILGAPGWGKTTLLRDLIRQRSDAGLCVSVVDEREELFPKGIPRGENTEVLTGCPKAAGVELLLRVMSPQVIAMDEVTSGQDCTALESSAWCGVQLMATAHASSLADYLHRGVYAPLVQQNLFDTIVVLHRDKSWHLERSKGWTVNGSVRY